MPKFLFAPPIKYNSNYMETGVLCMQWQLQEFSNSYKILSQ